MPKPEKPPDPPAGDEPSSRVVVFVPLGAAAQDFVDILLELEVRRRRPKGRA